MLIGLSEHVDDMLHFGFGMSTYCQVVGELKLDHGSLMCSGFHLQPTEVENVSISAIYTVSGKKWDQ